METKPQNKINIQVESEIGELEAVILHTPGPEIENMTPAHAERALYSDILNLSVAGREYANFQGVLEKVTNTFQVKSLLQDILGNKIVRHDLINKICSGSDDKEVKEFLTDKKSDELARYLIEGVPKPINSLTSYLGQETFSLDPLHNFFFTRDASSTVYNRVLINRMANQVRMREAMIMESIFDNHPNFVTKTMNPTTSPAFNKNIQIEGGDVLIARKDVLIIGTGVRTSAQGIDYLANQIESNSEIRHIIVQQLPSEPESFIHLDMVFTLLDKDTCMVYAPIIMKHNRYTAIHLTIKDGEITSINEHLTLLAALKNVGMDLKPVLCGGSDPKNQEREQWHSGANFFSFAPGKIIGYARNVHTIEALNKDGFSVLKSADVISGKEDVKKHKKAVVTIPGAELARGGGGARCMTMPIKRKEVNW